MNFVMNLAPLVPKIRITKEDGSPQQPPQILIGGGLRYQALPTGLEMQPFIEALTALDSGPIADNGVHQKPIEKK